MKNFPPLRDRLVLWQRLYVVLMYALILRMQRVVLTLTPPSDDECSYEQYEDFYECYLSLVDDSDGDDAGVLSEGTHVDAVDYAPPNPKKCSYPSCDMHRITNSNFPDEFWNFKTGLYNNNCQGAWEDRKGLDQGTSR